MSSVKSASSLGDPNGKDGSEGAILKSGYIRKLKTMKKKFFIIRGDSTDSSVSTARIEYYDSEKKWRTNHSPKRSILLKTCFNINRRTDTKHKYVIALYTKDDCFCLVFDTEEEMADWLKALLALQQGEDIVDGESPKPTFEHVWPVNVAKRGLGSTRNILGPHLLCLTDKTLSLVNKQSEKNETYEFSLTNIRRCGDMESFFYMEVGRSSCTGAGDLWMQTLDVNIAQNMHTAILHAMSNNSNNKEEFGPRPRNRSSSANDASKPISVRDHQRRQTQYAGQGKSGSFFTADDGVPSVGTASSATAASYNDHLANPATVPVNAQSTQVTSVGSLPGSNVHTYQHYHQRISAHPPLSVQRPSQRRHSVSAMTVTPMKGGPTHQRTHSFPLSDPSALLSWDTRRGSTGRVGKRSGGSVQRSTTNSGRDRCDSMPSRPRTTSEGHHGQAAPHTVRNVHLVPGHNRPHSMYTRGISYSPPVGSSPVSPNSAACSTDSAGSSLSVDDEHNWMEAEPNIFGMGRYGHSLTPDEPIIFEENIIEGDENSTCTTEEKLNNYMPMNSSVASLSLPIKPTIPIKFSPNLSGGGFKSGSPSGYMEMYSPCGSSPLDTVGAFITTSPGPGASADLLTRYGRSASSASHSRASSLAEDGYVPMAPGQGDDGYVDMDPAPVDHFGTGDMSPGNSSCSIASGTPSTDLRFSEYPLEKVSSYFTPSEEDDQADRPARAYSVGSRPCSTPKNRREPGLPASESSRVRAFSVGSRVAKAAFLSRHAVPTATVPSATADKSNSAPLLSHSWSGSPTLKPPLYASGEPMDDLMEMDFSKNSQKSIKNRTNLRSSRIESSLPIQTTSTPHDKLTVPLNNLNISPNNLNISPNNLSSSPTATQDTSGYLDMTPSRVGLNALSSPTPIPVTPKNSGPYVEMKPGFGIDLSRCHSASPPQVNHLTRNVVLSGSPKSSFMACSPPTRTLMNRKTSVLGSAPYVDALGQVSEPRVGSPGATYTHSRSNDYMDMRGPQPQHFPSTSGPTHIPGRAVDTFPLARKPTSPIQEEYMDMSMKQVKQESNLANRSAPVNTPQPRVVPDPSSAYVDMSSGPSNRGLVPSGQADDYMNMNMSNESRRRKGRGSRKDKQRFSSQPIAIQSGQSSSNDSNSKPGSSASTSPVFSLANMMTSRKTSTGTPPKIPGFLPLGSGNTSPGSSPYSSLRRSRHRKAARRGSSETNLTTPTGSTTGIFPFSLNSPGSPMKPLPGGRGEPFEYDRKCPVDASSGTVCISYPYPDGSSGSNPATPDSSSSSEQPTPVNAEAGGDLPKKDRPVSDYVNYSPARKLSQELPSKADEFGEYAFMRPVVVNPPNRRISTPMFATTNNFDKSPQKKFSLSTTISTPTLVSTKIVNAPAVLKTTPLKQATVLPSASFKPISVNPTAVVTNSSDGSSSPKLKSLFASTKITSLFNRQLSSTSASSTESGKSQEVSVKDTSASVPAKGAGAVSRQLSNSSVKSLSGASESTRDDGTYENLSTCSSGGVSPVPSSRPESVSCEREIHYASLDLATADADDGAKSPRNFKAQSSLTESTPSPNPGQEASFTYAEIDFDKSECLKNCSSTTANRKVYH